jgi:Dolichyl-phosphate-mannose-protein mannosyltransferase
MVLILSPLVLSAFTHLWNPVGFPAIYVDEDIYMRHAIRALEGLGLVEGRFYEAPFFGWLFLAGSLGAIGYPGSLHPTSDGNVHSIEMLYLIPRVLMGLLAIVDTFLIYKIAERQYNNNKTIAFIASVLFAVMPMTWITRWILLDTIQLPFLLSSILLALYVKGPQDNHKAEETVYKIPSPATTTTATNHNNKKRRVLSILLSGIFLGLAILTKIPVFAMILLVGYLVYTSNNRSLKTLGLWITPVILIPLIWPGYAIFVGEFDSWWDGIIYQTHREPLPLFDLIGEQPQNSINILLYKVDPILMIMGFAGLVYAAIRRDFFLLLWIVPFVSILYVINHVFFYYVLPLFPAFCIAIGRLISDISYKVKKIRNILPYAIISGIAIFGLVSTTMLITTNINSTHFKAAAFIGKGLPSTHSTGNYNDEINGVTLISGERRYFWIFTEVFHKYPIAMSYWEKKPISTNKILIVIEDVFDWWSRSESNKVHITQLMNICNDAQTIMKFNRNTDAYDSTKYPYTNIIPSLGIGSVEIRANAEAASLFKGLQSLKTDACNRS